MTILSPQCIYYKCESEWVCAYWCVSVCCIYRYLGCKSFCLQYHVQIHVVHHEDNSSERNQTIGQNDAITKPYTLFVCAQKLWSLVSVFHSHTRSSEYASHFCFFFVSFIIHSIWFALWEHHSVCKNVRTYYRYNIQNRHLRNDYYPKRFSCSIRFVLLRYFEWPSSAVCVSSLFLLIIVNLSISEWWITHSALDCVAAQSGA